MSRLSRYLTIATFAAGVAALSLISEAVSGPDQTKLTSSIPVTHYRTAKIEGTDIFYREAGPADAPVVLLYMDSQRRRICSAT
jgi:hypothetical protein